jgi:hypothetical protein
MPNAGNLFATLNPSATAECQESYASRPKAQLSGPGSLLLLGLVFAITFWGFGYKLSYYYFGHQTPESRALFSKTWIEPRNATVAAVSGLVVKSHLVSGQDLPLPSFRALSQPESAVKVPGRAQAACVGFSRSSLSPRAPPSGTLSLA